MNKVLELQNHLRNRIFTVFLHRDTMYVSVVSSNYVSRKFIAILMTPTVGTTNENKPFMYSCLGFSSMEKEHSVLWCTFLSWLALVFWSWGITSDGSGKDTQISYLLWCKLSPCFPCNRTLCLICSSQKSEHIQQTISLPHISPSHNCEGWKTLHFELLYKVKEIISIHCILKLYMFVHLTRRCY